MKYYIKHNGKTWGPLEVQDIKELINEKNFDNSLRLSVDTLNWYAAEELDDFYEYIRQNPLPEAAIDTDAVQPLPIPGINYRKMFLKFLLFCIVVIAGYGVVIYKIVKSEPVTEFNQSDLYNAANLPAVYEKYQNAIGLVTVTIELKDEAPLIIPIGTAFAVAPDKFVTNAHVAYALKEFQSELLYALIYMELRDAADRSGLTIEDFMKIVGSYHVGRLYKEWLNYFESGLLKICDPVIRLNHSNGMIIPIAAVRIHSEYNPDDRNNGEYDLAVLDAAQNIESYFMLAAGTELYNIKPGTPIASAGFPLEGIFNAVNLEKPEASYASGDIKQITDFEKKDSGVEQNRSIVHSIPVTGGVSGSPVFTPDGKVIAVIWGGSFYLSATGQRAPGLLHNYAVRIDQLSDMGEKVSIEDWMSTESDNLYKTLSAL